MPISSVSTAPEHMNLPSQHYTIPSTNTLPSSVITQPPTFIPTTSQVPISQPAPHPYTFNIPTCAALSSQLHTFDGIDYYYRLENNMNCIKARIIYQLGPQPTHTEQHRIWNIRKIAIFATSLDGPASFRLNNLSETYTQGCSIFSTKFLKTT